MESIGWKNSLGEELITGIKNVKPETEAGHDVTTLLKEVLLK